MTKAIEDVTTVEVTTATRTVEIDGVSVEQGQVIALVNGKLAISAASVEEACLGALAYAHADDFELDHPLSWRRSAHQRRPTASWM